MNNVAFLPIEPSSAKVSLGPATVTALGAESIEVCLTKTDRRVRATMALAVPYEPALGDVVLTIGEGADHYVIGVIRGAGKTTLELPGDIDLRAVGGTLRLSGDRGVAIEGSEIAVRARTLSTFAESVVEHAGSALRHVRELFTMRAGQTHTVVDGSTFSQSKSHAIVAEEKVTVNGKGIYLG